MYTQFVINDFISIVYVLYIYIVVRGLVELIKKNGRCLKKKKKQVGLVCNAHTNRIKYFKCVNQYFFSFPEHLISLQFHPFKIFSDSLKFHENSSRYHIILYRYLKLNHVLT